MLLEMSRKDFTPEYLSGSVPVLVTDGLADWPCLGRWSPKNLADVGGQIHVRLAGSRSGIFSNDQFFLEDVSLKTVVDMITDGRDSIRYYCILRNIPQHIPQLLQDLRFPPPTEPSRMNLWFGSSGTVTSLHFDIANGLFAQVYGSKRFTIFSPNETSHLYPFPNSSKTNHMSPIDVEKPDVQQFPLFAGARPIAFTIRQGQLLFLPAFWWHDVRSQSVSVSVNAWWWPDPIQFRGPKALAYLKSICKNGTWEKIGGLLSPRALLKATQALVESDPSIAILSAYIAIKKLGFTLERRLPRELNSGLDDLVATALATDTPSQDLQSGARSVTLAIHELIGDSEGLCR